MKKYKYLVTLTVDVDAFDESDAWEAIQDSFGIGETNGLDVLTCEWEEIAT